MQRSDLQIIFVLGEEKNMRKAAERLFVSQPALSQRLQSIERDWGTPLFVRSKRGLDLTPEGERVAQFAKETIEKEDKLRESLISDQSEVYGTLKIAVASIIGQYWLPKVLKRFVERYPLVKISLVTGWSSEILHHMYEDDGHIGIIRGNPKWRGYKRHLFTDALNLVDTTLESLEELDNYKKPFIQFRSDSTYYQEIQDWWHNHFKKTPKRTIIVDQIETCKQMALNGIGYAILPSVSLTDRDYGINKIPLEDKMRQGIERDTWLLAHEDAIQLKQVKAFIDLLNEE
ncbi:DNA-binding transcriptional LysR family regulator [Pullulanibacillus pueri]|uniref:Putative HTH-type transcriptional regulator YkuM n=1 Tax=Pullulanibacillus pueri TaxID=1437324 RepID=A0A8J2ZS26_9BACL|nr:LysR family transcriptional regulator [Pullulanibacillus pueri]MBM7680051.1 DNA-binding transcriptional LysR family regulator [Pullulanibacillus pueri]GGH74120.1 putative HTH-type transcriptional regulator YkuM [Pullulanibacillus pueri]